jgi:hypothetical protein
VSPAPCQPFLFKDSVVYADSSLHKEICFLVISKLRCNGSNSFLMFIIHCYCKKQQLTALLFIYYLFQLN